jgi:hypothetical protein
MPDQLQHPDMPERDNPLGLEPDAAEALRLSAALARQESGVALDLDQREAPELASLLQTVSAVSAAFDHSTETEAFERFYHRTRTNVIAGTPEPVTTAPSMPKQSLLQRWNSMFVAAGAAAAASIATLVVTVVVLGNSAPAAPLVSNVQPADATPQAVVQPADATPQAAVAVIDPAPAEPEFNLTALSVDTQLDIWLDTLLQVAALTADGDPVDAPLLHLLADVTASVTRQIESDPESVSGAVVFLSYHAAFSSGQTLNEATVAAESDQPALDTAQVAADEAFVVAARYFDQNPDRIPSVDDVSSRRGTDATTSEDGTTTGGLAP